jgi:UDP-N-acetylglucosamine--N-acetylmuramyl-(pentapeptide) pyrophosphoryl-undecaprenol N-acetylglucosamine transferase
VSPGIEEPGVFALLSGGGTGGHTYPAIAVAQELVQRGHTVRFVGGRRGIEGRVVPEAGFEIDLLAGRGLQRRHLVANLAQNLAAIFGALSAVVHSIAIVRRHRPRIVVGFGGYASFPCVLAARILRVPVVVHEQDAAPGLANRMSVRLGARPAVSLPGTPLPHATLTGNPVRAAFAHLERVPHAAGDPALVAVFGGAQGARSINRAALGCYDGWRARRDLAVRHVCGPRNLHECETELARARHDGDALRYEVVGYEERMDLLYARTALAVCRSGAGTIAELTAAGLPAVLVPLPGAPSDHQTRNAQTLERAGAAVMLRDDECDPEHLDRIVTGLLGETERLERMGRAAYGLGRRDAAERLADLVESHARAA